VRQVLDFDVILSVFMNL